MSHADAQALVEAVKNIHTVLLWIEGALVALASSFIVKRFY